MVHKITQNSLTSEKYKKRYTFHLRTMCIFCEETKDFSSDYWVEHIRGHTGEYCNQCILCQKLCKNHTHCGLATARIDDFNLIHNELCGYRCIDCNYVQLNEENIRSHLTTQHNFSENEIADQYETFTILKSFDSLPYSGEILIEGMPSSTF